MATVYDLITERIVEKLQQGTIPWQKLWNSAAGLPRTLSSQQPYRGINVWVLGSAGYTSPYWLTFKQAKEIGGHVRKGEKSFPVVFWKWLDGAGEVEEREESRTATRRVPLARLLRMTARYVHVGQSHKLAAMSLLEKAYEHKEELRNGDQKVATAQNVQEWQQKRQQS